MNFKNFLGLPLKRISIQMPLSGMSKKKGRTVYPRLVQRRVADSGSGHASRSGGATNGRAGPQQGDGIAAACLGGSRTGTGLPTGGAQGHRRLWQEGPALMQAPVDRIFYSRWKCWLFLGSGLTLLVPTLIYALLHKDALASALSGRLNFLPEASLAHDLMREGLFYFGILVMAYCVYTLARLFFCFFNPSWFRVQACGGVLAGPSGGAEWQWLVRVAARGFPGRVQPGARAAPSGYIPGG